MGELATASPENGVGELWAKESSKLQGQIVTWKDCFQKKSDMARLTYVFMLIILSFQSVTFLLFFNYCFHFHIRCHLRQGPEAVRLISLTAHSLKIHNSELIQKFYNNFKAKCKDFRPWMPKKNFVTRKLDIINKISTFWKIKTIIWFSRLITITKIYWQRGF